MMEDFPDRILMEGMVFHGHVGVLEVEKRNGQPFQVDAILHCRRLAACDNDRLDQTINYSQAFALIRQLVESARFDLIESLANQIALALLDRYTLIQAVEITVRKPEAPIDGCFSAMGIRIYRERG